MEARCVICKKRSTCDHPEPIVDTDGSAYLGAMILDERCYDYELDFAPFGQLVAEIGSKHIETTKSGEISVWVLSAEETVQTALVIQAKYDVDTDKMALEGMKKLLPKSPFHIVFMTVPGWAVNLALLADAAEIVLEPDQLVIRTRTNLSEDQREDLAEEAMESLYALSQETKETWNPEDLRVCVAYLEEAMDDSDLEESMGDEIYTRCPICGAAVEHWPCPDCGYHEPTEGEDPDA